MHGQFRSIVLLSAVASLSAAVSHRFEAKFRVLPDRQVQIDAWFGVTRQPARDAKLKAFQGEELVFEGNLDENGSRTFSYNRSETMQVIVDAGAGHRVQLRIPETELSGTLNSAPDPATRAINTSVDLRDVLLGVTALLATAAFLLSWRNARRLRSMEKNH